VVSVELGALASAGALFISSPHAKNLAPKTGGFGRQIISVVSFAPGEGKTPVWQSRLTGG
jgi:hypothetical protein